LQAVHCLAMAREKSRKRETLHPTPPRKLSFQAWHKRFEQLLGNGEPSWAALRKWTETIEDFRRSDRIMRERDPLLKQYIRPHEADARTVALKSLYRETCPSDLEPGRARRRHEAWVVDALAELASQAENFSKGLRQQDINIEAEGGAFSVDLTPIAEAYETAARDSRYVLDLLKRPYTHEANLVRQCVYLYIRLTERIRAKDREAVQLLKIALRAHGYAEERLKEFAPRTGTLRKRAQVVTEESRTELTQQLYGQVRYSRALLRPVPMKVLPPGKRQ
jgi:hypothetical protein